MAKSDGKKRHKKMVSVKLYKEKVTKGALYRQELEHLKTLYEQTDDTCLFENFSDLPLSSNTLKGLEESKYTKLTDIQKESIVLGLKGHDILGAAKTGSGKTLAFVIPVLECLFREGWSKVFGLGALIITPTRELAFQIFEVFRKVGQFHNFTIGLVIGGKDLKTEKSCVNKYNIVIGTPGRLLHHMSQNGFCDALSLQILVLDEADRILDLGFEEDMNAIIGYLPENRQTLLFSATQTKSVKDLARLSLKEPKYVSVHEHSKYATPESLIQSYLVCEAHDKLNFLWSFLVKHRKQKILVFMASCKQVKYAFSTFCRLQPGVSVTALYGGLHQMKRMERYRSFCNKQHIVMFATDIAARGLDFPHVNWVIQLDCPEDVNTYIHRAGRTARYQEGGESVLVLLPSEQESMIKQIEARRIPISEIKCNPADLYSVTKKLEYICADDKELLQSAQRAFGAYLKHVFLMKDKTVFDVRKIDMESYARSLGLIATPRTRFISKRLKNQQKSEPASNPPGDDSGMKNSERSSNMWNTIVKDSGTEDSADILVAKEWCASDSLPSDILSQGRVIGSGEMKPEMPVAPKKVITKAAAVKKLLKKNVKLNTKILFEEEEAADTLNVPVNSSKKEDARFQEDDAHRTLEEKISRIKIEMDKNDKVIYRTKMKKKHKEERQKLKELKQTRDLREVAELPKEASKGKDDSSYRREELKNFINELPDPDEYYGKKSDDDDDDDFVSYRPESLYEGEESMSETGIDQPTENKQKQKRKRKKKMESPRKRSKLSIELPSTVAPALSLGGDEELALNLLQGL